MRNKLKIQKLEDAKKRAASYLRRKSTLLKEVKELSDSSSTKDVAFLMFSPIPDDMPILYTNTNNDLSQVVKKLSEMAIQQKSKRALLTIKMLRKSSLKKNGHDINIDTKKFKANGAKRVEDLAKELNKLCDELNEIKGKISKWSDSTTINDSVVLKDMEKFLVNELNQLQTKKETLMEKSDHDPWMLQEAIVSPREACSQGMDVTSLGENGDITQIASTSGGNGGNLENGQPFPPP